MKEFIFTVNDSDGIHARPAGLLVKEANKYNSQITIKHGDKTADAKKIFSIMGLAAKKSDNLQITICGDDENVAAENLEKFLKNNM